MPLREFKTVDFNSQIQRSLAKVYLSGASVGEVEAVAGRIDDGDAPSWHAAWRGLADDLENRSETARAGGQDETARRLFLRAAEAHRQATFYHRVDLDCAELQTGWPRVAVCFLAALALGGMRAESLEIPFEGRFLHGMLITPDSADVARPTLMLPSGYDSMVEEAVFMTGLPALARGYAVVAFDGPGQGKTLYDPASRAFMRPDYEVVIRAVVDAVVDRPEVNGERMAAVGCSFGGYLVPRAAGGEARLAAIVADPGQYDLGVGVRQVLPETLRDRVWEDSDEAAAAFAKLAEGTRGQFLFGPRMAAHGATSVQAYVRQMQAFTNAESALNIRCPCLICDNEIDVVSTGQGEQLAAAITAPVEFVRFTQAEGAGGHCEGVGREMFDEHVFPWLDKVLRCDATA